MNGYDITKLTNPAAVTLIKNQPQFVTITVIRPIAEAPSKPPRDNTAGVATPPHNQSQKVEPLTIQLNVDEPVESANSKLGVDQEFQANSEVVPSLPPQTIGHGGALHQTTVSSMCFSIIFVLTIMWWDGGLCVYPYCC